MKDIEIVDALLNREGLCSGPVNVNKECISVKMHGIIIKTEFFNWLETFNRDYFITSEFHLKIYRKNGS